MSLLAQVNVENLIGPGAQVTAAGVLFFVTRWLMAVHREDMAKMVSRIDAFDDKFVERMNSSDRALFLNTQATMLMGIAQDESSNVVKAKLKSCLQELETAEALRLKQIEERKK